MGEQILRQPDGKYAVFSTVTDTIHLYDATRDEIIDYYVQRDIERVRRDLESQLTAIDAGEPRRVYYQFAMSWDEALTTDQEHGGEAWREFLAR